MAYVEENMHRGRPPSTNLVRSDASYIVDGSPLRKSTARNYRRYGHSPEPWHGIGDPRKRTTPTFTPSLTPDNDHCNVKVAVRLRPDPNAHRNQIPSKKCVSVDNTCTSVTVDQMGLSVMQDILVQPRTFKFDYVADENVDQAKQELVRHSQWKIEGDLEFVIKCSYLQIYNEQVADLLYPESTNLTIHEDTRNRMHVDGLQEVVVSTPEATYELFQRGSLNRTVGMTAMNAESSRSHVVFSLSVVTEDALGGNSKCALIANINPGLVNIDETLSTLKFAQRAKLMHNLAILNEYDDPGSIAEELRRLRLEVTALRGKIGRVLLNDHRAPMAHEYRDRGRIRRIESMLTQLSKDAFGSGKRSADEMHALSLKVESTKALCQKLDKFLQSQKRTPGGKIANSITESTEQLLNPVTQPVNQLDSTKYDSELDLCKAKLQRYERQRRNGQLLQAQINQLESLNKTMQQGIEEILEEKRDIFAELLEMRRERDESKADIEDLKAQISNLQQSLDRYLPAKNLKENIVRRSRKTLSKAEVVKCSLFCRRHSRFMYAFMEGMHLWSPKMLENN